MSLPSFLYHPDPILSGSISISAEPCACCGKSRGYAYTGPVYGEHYVGHEICPWCIADGKAHAKLEATFVDAACFPDAIPRQIVGEVTRRTPGFNAKWRKKWLTCCGDAMAFLEPAGLAEIRASYPPLEDLIMKHVVDDMKYAGAASKEFLASLDRERGPTAHIFRCLYCRTEQFYLDYL